ncbi:MAG: hypothetical protein ACE5GX_04500 [Thermoanaerobaculia bacterium]
MPEVTICDVSLRDGMQIMNRHAVIPLESRLQLAEALVRADVPYIEVGSFVSPKVVPAMADTAELLQSMPPYGGQIAALAPTLEYYELLKQAERVNTVALFVAASEAYSQANTRMSVDEALDAAEEIAKQARRDGYQLRGYLSYAFRDKSQPDEETPVELTEAICRRLVDMGCGAVALSDTDGLATPMNIERVVEHIGQCLGLDSIGVHLHDRRGLGVTNAYVAYRAGVRIFDASIGGIGGAITVRHSVGNVATEELVSMFESLGVDTGIDVQPLIEAGCRVSQMADFVGDPPPPSKIILDELAMRRAEIEASEGPEADLSLRELLRSLLGLIPRVGPDDDLSVGERLEEAREQVSLFLHAPTNRAAVLFSLFSMLMATGIAALFVRVLPTTWVARIEVIAITLFSLGMVMLLGILLTMIQVSGGVRLPRELNPRERAILRDAIKPVAERLSASTGFARQYEV